MKDKYLLKKLQPTLTVLRVTNLLVMMEYLELISDPFMECERECFNHGDMSSSQRKAIIENPNLIEKQHKDRTLIENWRPFSLINVDAKIISKLIALRLKKFCRISYIIIKQLCYVEDRYIGETIRSIFDIRIFQVY